MVFAHGANSANPRHIAAGKWAELFADRTAGVYTMNHAPSATMGDDAEMLTSAAPAPLTWTDLPSVLQSGAFDGQENPLVNI